MMWTISFRMLSFLAFFAFVRIKGRAVARSENPGGHVVLGVDNVPLLVEIGLVDLPKSGRARAPPDS